MNSGGGVQDGSVDPIVNLRRRWPLALALALVGALAGLALASFHTTQTTAEARLAIGSGSLQAWQVAGFGVASEQLAANYARYLSDASTSQDVLQESLGDDVDSVVSVDASPIPDSNVIRVEATATDPKAAVGAAQALAENLQQQVTGGAPPSPEELLSQYTDIALKVQEQALVVEDASRSTIAKERARLAQLTVRQNALGAAYQQSLIDKPTESGLRLVQRAAVMGDDRVSTYQVYALGGLLAGVVVALIAVNLASWGRRGSTRRTRG